ncbi:hypothetical protein, partial [Methylobacterium crusticola]|uniref:hypothetical protein n=1 Tax=Methylobacterium crusticola TaxID=1697972 RepID=UPI001EE25CC7
LAIVESAIEDEMQARRGRQGLPLTDFFRGGPKVLVSHADGRAVVEVTSVRSPMRQGAQEPACHSRFYRFAMPMKDESESAHDALPSRWLRLGYGFTGNVGSPRSDQP